ncbi:hypothetical protein M514_14309 [Trichuris suis]|uniref:DUF5641 domain-containing protein n=1 Tax=Trichuris suis TaxID=68888 RepID=A0A085MU54_9BILA|nr:hypothetical protein M514_14309 [Trichuris suis]
MEMTMHRRTIRISRLEHTPNEMNYDSFRTKHRTDANGRTLPQPQTPHKWDKCERKKIVTLSTRKKWTNTTAESQIGDIVLIAEDNVGRCKWPVGRVVQKFPSHDGFTPTENHQRNVYKACGHAPPTQSRRGGLAKAG